MTIIWWYDICTILFLFRDNVPAMLLSSWNLDATMFEGDQVAGPIMTLFAEDVEATTAAITANPAKAYADYQRIVRAFFMPETVDSSDAEAIVKKPR